MTEEEFIDAALSRVRAKDIERLTAERDCYRDELGYRINERDALRKALIGLLMTDHAGERKDWPEYIAARLALEHGGKA